MRVLVAEDHPRIANAVARGLRREGMAVDVAEDGAAALYKARINPYDIVVLDRDLPELHGDEVCRTLSAEQPRTKVLMLTAARSTDDLVEGLALGADDYLSKPFRFAELVARVRLRLRTTTETVVSEDLSAGDVRLDVRSRRAFVGDREVDLSAREFALAEVLLRHRGQALSREQLLSHVWGYDFDPGSNIVDVYVGYLRKKLGPELVTTVRGVGYRAG